LLFFDNLDKHGFIGGTDRTLFRWLIPLMNIATNGAFPFFHPATSIQKVLKKTPMGIVDQSPFFSSAIPPSQS
jgi:hypothetical protein